MRDDAGLAIPLATTRSSQSRFPWAAPRFGNRLGASVRVGCAAPRSLALWRALIGAEDQLAWDRRRSPDL